MDVADDIARITGWGTAIPDPIHEVTDWGHREALADDMYENGWQGPPIICDGWKGITGVHRMDAWREVGGGHDYPCIDIADLCEYYDADWHAHVQEREEFWEDEPFADPWYEAVASLPDILPAEVIDYLGIDVH